VQIYLLPRVLCAQRPFVQGSRAEEVSKMEQLLVSAEAFPDL
jgi:hypothetical protein